MSLLGPLSKIVHALGFLHSVTKQKYLLTNKSNVTSLCINQLTLNYTYMYIYKIIFIMFLLLTKVSLYLIGFNLSCATSGPTDKTNTFLSLWRVACSEGLVVSSAVIIQVKTYSSPNLLISNNPAPVPTSSSFSSSVLFTMVAPHARAIRLLSVFLMRRIAVISFFTR